jgi:pentatricopeptide repeat protein
MIASIMELLLENRVKLDATTLAMTVSACGHSRDMASALSYWDKMTKTDRIKPNNSCFAALFVASARCRDMQALKTAYKNWTDSTSYIESEGKDGAWDVLIMALGKEYFGVLKAAQEESLRDISQDPAAVPKLKVEIEKVLFDLGTVT